MGEALRDPKGILWSGSLSNRDGVGSIVVIVNIIIITMYKYTYLLSQSYRSDATIINGSCEVGLGCGKGLENVEVGYKIMPRNVAQRKEYAVGIGGRNAQYKTAER